MAGLQLLQGRLRLAVCGSLQHSKACHGAACLQPARSLRQGQRQSRQPLCCRAESCSEASGQQWSPAVRRGVLVLLAENLWQPQLALADSIQYDPSQGSEAIKYVFGAAYILGAALFFWKVFGRRAKRFREEVPSGGLTSSISTAIMGPLMGGSLNYANYWSGVRYASL